MAGLMKLDDIKCYRCRHPRNKHYDYGRPRAGGCTHYMSDGYSRCDCAKYLDPNLHLTLTEGGTVSGSIDPYKAAFARQQLTTSQKRGRLIPRFTFLWGLQWTLSLAMILLGIWTSEHWQFIWTGVTLFIGGGVTAIVRTTLWDANKGAVIQAHDSY